jgi:MFS family permease
MAEDVTTDSGLAWRRLVAAMALGTVGGVGMWSVVVALPAVQTEFGVDRAAAALPYTLTMLGFAVGSLLMGRLADRVGIVPPLVVGTVCLALGYGLSALTTSLWQFAVVHGVLVGALGSSVAFGPLMADVSRWFWRRRGLAVALCASGNFLAGTLWPPIVEHGIHVYGWRTTQAGIGLFCLVAMLPLALLMRGRAPPASATSAAGPQAAMALSPTAIQGLLVVAGLACCVAMAMPQVHIVAYCSDLGYGVAHGAQMLSLMFGFGIVSRVASGFVADRIGGLATLLAGALLQAVALALYLAFDGLTSLYVISALFGLFQGGIVPAYAIIVREYLPAEEAGARIGAVLMATLAGMALGGWLTGAIFDATGSYRAAFINGLAWNAINVAIVLWLIHCRRPRTGLATI